MWPHASTFLCSRSHLLAACVIAALAAGPASAASTWDDLPASVQNTVKQELTARLPEMFPEGDQRDLAEFFASNVEDWAKFADDIHTGKHYEAQQYLANKASAWFFEQLKARLPEGSTARTIYDFISPRSEAAKQMVIVALDRNKDWKDVGQIAWDQAKQELQTTINIRTRSYVVSTINMVFGERQVLGHSAGDAYILMVQTWREVIAAEERRFVQDTENRLYAAYRDARKSGGQAAAEEHVSTLETAGRVVHDDSASAGSTRTYHSGLVAAGVELKDLLRLFDRFYATEQGKYSDDFYGWLALAATERLSANADTTRTSVEQGMKVASASLQQDVAAVQAAAARELARLIEQKLTEEQKKARAEALASIEPMLRTLYEQTMVRMRDTCAAYDAAKADALALLNAYRDVRNTDFSIEYALDSIERHQKVAQAATELNAAFADLAQREDALRTAFEELPDLVTETCEHASAVQDAADKQTARRHLDDTIDAAGRARRRAQPALTAVDGLAEKANAIRTEIERIHDRFGFSEPDALRNAYAELQRELDARDVYEDAKAAYEAAHNKMAQTVETAAKIQQSYKQRRATIVSALKPHNVNDALAAAWDKIRQVDQAAQCLGAIQWDWDCGPEPGDGFGGRAWKERRLPYLSDADPDLVKRARAALAKGKGLAEMESLAHEHSRMGRLAGLAKEMEAELASQNFDVEVCLAHAIKTYADKWKDESDIVTSANPGAPPPPDASPGDPNQPAPDMVAYIIKVTGAGWTPHWAGGSYIFDGSNEEILWVPRDQNPRPLMEEYERRLDISPCDAEIPGWPGMSQRPLIWNSGPHVDKVDGPFLDTKELRNRNYANNWNKLGRNGPSLGEIRKRAGCQ